MPERTEHGHDRHEQGDRPTRYAFSDKENPLETYIDLETDFMVYVGPNRRTHLFTKDGQHHTSFRTTRIARRHKVRRGRWQRI